MKSVTMTGIDLKYDLTRVPKYSEEKELWYWQSSYCEGIVTKNMIRANYYDMIPCCYPFTLCVEDDSSSLRKYFKSKNDAFKAYKKAMKKYVINVVDGAF